MCRKEREGTTIPQIEQQKEAVVQLAAFINDNSDEYTVIIGGDWNPTWGTYNAASDLSEKTGLELCQPVQSGNHGTKAAASLIYTVVDSRLDMGSPFDQILFDSSHLNVVFESIYRYLRVASSSGNDIYNVSDHDAVYAIFSQK